MRAHKVDGKNPTSYSSLPLAAQKLERWAEARDPLLPKYTTMGGSNVTQPQKSENLFPSQKLKGRHTFTAQSATVESNRVTEDLSMKAEEAEDGKSSDEENPETSSGFSRADQLVGYIIHFANAVKLYQKKT